jgi:hypothetical protein
MILSLPRIDRWQGLMAVNGAGWDQINLFSKTRRKVGPHHRD